MKYGKEPPRDYMEVRVNKDYYEASENFRCPGCGYVITYRMKDLPMRVVCPRCKKEGILK